MPVKGMPAPHPISPTAGDGITPTAKPKPVWTGRMSRDQATGAITGYVRDVWGWTVEFVAVRDNEGYRLDCVMGEIPAALRIPVLDGSAG